MNKTDQRLIQMLKQNTGQSILDSGSAYGRHWEENQERDFLQEPEITLEFTQDDILFRRNVFHFLRDFLEFDPEMQRRFDQFEVEESDPYENWFDTVESFIKSELIYQPDVSDLPEGWHNTYNSGPDMLSQIIQFRVVPLQQEQYVVLQIHNGCDIRGGYTDPTWFTGEVEQLFCTRDGVVSCMNWHIWETDDNWNWRPDGACPDGCPNLKKFERRLIEDCKEHDETVPEFAARYADEKQTVKQYGVDGGNILYYAEDGSGYCPLCGGLLTP